MFTGVLLILAGSYLLIITIYGGLALIALTQKAGKLLKIILSPIYALTILRVHSLMLKPNVKNLQCN